jgi:hypothetical protein
MANQMIALQARGPQLPDMGALTSRYANLMANTAVAREKQNSVERANAFRQLVSSDQFDPSNPQHIKAAQALDPEGAGKIAATYDKRQQDKQKYVGDFYNNSISVLANVRDPQELRMRADALIRNFPEFRDDVEKTVTDMNSSPDGFEAARNRALFRTQSAAEQMGYIFPKAKAEVTYGVDGKMQETRTGGLPGQGQGVFPLQEFELDTSGGKGGPLEAAPTAAAPASGNTLAVDLRNAAAGVRNEDEYQTWLSMVGKVDPQLGAQIRQFAPRLDTQKMRTIIGAVNEALGGAGGGVGGPDIPMVAGARGGPYVATGRQAYGKDPMQSPAPGTNIQTLPRIKRENAAEESGKQGVRVVTEPVIAGGSKAAELRAQRDNEYPEARGRFEANLARIDDMIEMAKTLRKHPAYRRIVGPIDAYTPNLTGGAMAAQQIYNSLTAKGTTEELQAMRQASPTGGAVGNVSDADIKLLSNAFGALGQGQDEGDFDTSLTSLVNKAMQARQRLVNQYRDTYQYRLPKNWTPPALATTRPKPKPKGTKVGQFIVTEGE